jgi:MFS transporter, NNP family, nitrate/nitrite transporter
MKNSRKSSTMGSPTPTAAREEEVEAPGRYRVLTLSTFAFTLMFAAWLQFGILAIPIQEEFGLSDTQFYWLTALPVLNGSIWRLATGIWADRFGGRNVMLALLLISAVPSAFLSRVESVTSLFILAFLIGFAGNSFSSGIAWNSAWFGQSHKGFALGVFGAGNVGASVTKLIGPTIISVTAGATFFGGLAIGGWRLVPFVYAIALLLTALAIFIMSPRPDRKPAASATFRQQLIPLREIRVWRFSIYYVAVFGAYVALSSALPKYYSTQFGVPLWEAALLTSVFIFPASLLRPMGGAFADRFGARRVMYWTFILMAVTSGLLMMPSGFIVVRVLESKSATGLVEVLPWSLNVWSFTFILFFLGCAMGVGKAAVYKFIPEYFPHHVGAVGGLVGMLGALGGFFLLPIFGYATEWSGIPSAPFGVLFVLTVVCFFWMHRTVHRLLQNESPDLVHKFEHAYRVESRD